MQRLKALHRRGHGLKRTAIETRGVAKERAQAFMRQKIVEMSYMYAQNDKDIRVLRTPMQANDPFKNADVRLPTVFAKSREKPLSRRTKIGGETHCRL